MSSKLQVGIVGLGKFGFAFGQELMEQGHKVIGVDQKPENVKLAQDIFTQVYHSEIREKKTLVQIGFAELNHVVISVGRSITTSLMVSMFLKELDVDQVWVKAVNPDHERLLEKIGVDRVLIPEKVAARQLANQMAMPGFVDYMPFGRDIAVVEIEITKWEGKTLRELDLTNKYQILVIAKKKNNKAAFSFIPRADSVLNEGDKLMVIGNIDQLEKLRY